MMISYDFVLNITWLQSFFHLLASTNSENHSLLSNEVEKMELKGDVEEKIMEKWVKTEKMEKKLKCPKRVRICFSTTFRPVYDQFLCFCNGIHLF